VAAAGNGGSAAFSVPLCALLAACLLFIPTFSGCTSSYLGAALNQIADSTPRHLEESTKTLTTTDSSFRAIFIRHWNLLSFLLTKWSKKTTRPPVATTPLASRPSPDQASFLYGFTISFAAIDWLCRSIQLVPPSRPVILIGEVLSHVLAVVVEPHLFNYKPMSEM